MKDLIILVADRDAEQLLQELLPRVPTREKISSFSFDIIKHPNRDNGVRKDAANFLRSYTKTHRKALVILDYEGSGADTTNLAISPQQLEQDIENKLVANGWQQTDICVCVIVPELENWVWVSDNALNNALNLEWNEEKTIRQWLETEAIDENTGENFVIDANNQKPTRPKEAFTALLDKQNETPSSSLFKKIGEKVSYKNCQDPAFCKMLDCLVTWFQKT